MKQTLLFLFCFLSFYSFSQTGRIIGRGYGETYIINLKTGEAYSEILSNNIVMTPEKTSERLPYRFSLGMPFDVPFRLKVIPKEISDSNTNPTNSTIITKTDNHIITGAIIDTTKITYELNENGDTTKIINQKSYYKDKDINKTKTKVTKTIKTKGKSTPVDKVKYLKITQGNWVYKLIRSYSYIEKKITDNDKNIFQEGYYVFFMPPLVANVNYKFELVDKDFYIKEEEIIQDSLNTLIHKICFHDIKGDTLNIVSKINKTIRTFKAKYIRNNIIYSTKFTLIEDAVFKKALSELESNCNSNPCSNNDSCNDSCKITKINFKLQKNNKSDKFYIKSKNELMKATTISDYVTRTEYHVVADLGIAIVNKENYYTSLQPYFGINFSFGSLNRQVKYSLFGKHLKHLKWPYRLGKNVSFMLGVTVNLDTDNVNFKNGKKLYPTFKSETLDIPVNLYNGLSIRIWDAIRLSGGFVWTKEAFNTGNSDFYRIDPSWFIAISFDADLGKYFGKAGDILFTKKP